MSKKILNEAQVRRWGTLAAIGRPLTENWLDHLTEEDEEFAAEEAPAEEDPAEELPAEEAPAGDIEGQVEDIVAAVVGAIADVTDVDISMDAEDEEAMEYPAAEELPAEEEAAEEEEAPANRDDFAIEVIDDEDLTEAVLKRVVERLLKRK
jgi:hypothetical protein